MNDLVVFTKKDVSENNKERLKAFVQQKGLEKYLKTQSTAQIQELMILFDATGSMSNVWNEAKNGIQKLFNRLSQMIPGIKISLLAYRDYNDQKIIELLPATDQLEKLEQFIEAIVCDGGDDEPEAVEVALGEMLKSPFLFGILVGDAPPHGVKDSARNGNDYKQVCHELKNAGKSVYTVATNQIPCTVSSFREIADISGGKFFLLEQIDDLIDILSLMAAQRVNKISFLTNLIKKEQGGKLTSRQKKLLD